MSQEKLVAIYNLVSDYMASDRDLLVSTQKLLLNILSISNLDTIDEPESSMTEETKEVSAEKVEIKEKVIEKFIQISCDASIKNNPGGPASVGVVIKFPDTPKLTQFAKFVPSNTNNEAEYDAVYEGLLFVSSMMNRPKYSIKIYSDSKLVVNQLNGLYKINEPALQKKFDSIHALAANIPTTISIEWMPRNSTPELSEANFIAQDILGVKRH